MNNLEKFQNDVLQPWGELNQLLVQRFAFQPALSRVARMAGSLAVAIRHLPEWFNVDEDAVLAGSVACRAMYDVGDAIKHPVLRDPGRRNSIVVSAQFEWNANGFRYVRNGVLIEHSSLGNLDFMVTSRDAIRCWIERMDWTLAWAGELSEADSSFYDEAFLYFDPRHQVSLNQMRLQFFVRENDELVPKDPPRVRVALYDLPQGLERNLL